MYENHANRTRFGDPQFIPDKWKHLPGNLDAYVHVWYYSHVAGAVINEAFFFKGMPLCVMFLTNSLTIRFYILSLSFFFLVFVIQCKNRFILKKIRCICPKIEP